MKKILTFILTATVMISMVLPLQGFALENKELEAAITTAKTLFNIADGYDDFNYGISKRNNATVYNLSWRDTKNKLGSTEVSIGTDGKVWNYSSYKPYDSQNHLKFPSVTKADALKISNAFFQKVDPAVYSKVRYQDDNKIVRIGDANYYFQYIRVENNVPFYNNNVSISVNNKTGEVQSYNYNWTDGLSFPDANGVLSMDKAKQAYSDKLGLKLLYVSSYNSVDMKPYLVYGETYTNRSIDAKTGEVITVSPYYYGGYGDAQLTEGAKKDAAANAGLSPEEAKAVEKASNLMDEKKAEDIGRKVLNIDSSCRLEFIRLYSNWHSKDDHTWNMSFVKDKTEDENEYFSGGITIDAATGEVISFNKSIPYDSKSAAQYDKDQCINIAKETIKSLYSDKINEVELTEWDDNNVKPLGSSELPKNYYFKFTRKTNGIYFPGNGFYVSVNAVKGVVTNFNLTWYKGELPSADKAISLSQAHESLFNNIGLELQYLADYPKNDAKKVLPSGTDVKPDLKLVYSIKPDKQLNIDAYTGNLLDNSGKPYSETSSVKEYTDIKGCLGENEIKTLAQYGISLNGTEFKPDSIISQRDFLYLLAKSINPYMEYDINTDPDESLYNYLVNSKIIKENEKAPASALTRQDATKFIIRSLKYDNIADIKGIYSLSFKDKDKINQNLLGYVSIAYGLNIIKDDNGLIKPTNSLTRSEAAIFIYNLLNIE